MYATWRKWVGNRANPYCASRLVLVHVQPLAGAIVDTDPEVGAAGRADRIGTPCAAWSV